MGKMNQNDRDTIWNLFEKDFREVQTAVNKQINAELEDARKVVRKKYKIDKADAAIKKQGKKIEATQNRQNKIQQDFDKVTRVHRQKMDAICNEIEAQSTKLQDMQENQLGDLGNSATNKTLKKLDIDVGQHAYYRKWHHLQCATELEALVCLEIKGRLDIEKPSKVMKSMRETISREFAFCSSKEEARELYEKFHGFNWQRYGADIAPLLSHVEGINGKVKLLPAGKKLAAAKPVNAKRKK